MLYIILLKDLIFLIYYKFVQYQQLILPLRFLTKKFPFSFKLLMELLQIRVIRKIIILLFHHVYIYEIQIWLIMINLRTIEIMLQISYINIKKFPKLILLLVANFHLFLKLIKSLQILLQIFSNNLYFLLILIFHFHLTSFFQF